MIRRRKKDKREKNNEDVRHSEPYRDQSVVDFVLVEEFLLVVLLEEHSNKRFHHSSVLEDNLVLVPVVDKHSIDMLVEHQERHPLLETVVEEVHLVLVDSSMEIEDLAWLEEDRIDWASLVVDASDSDWSSLAVVLVVVAVHQHSNSDILVDLNSIQRFVFIVYRKINNNVHIPFGIMVGC